MASAGSAASPPDFWRRARNGAAEGFIYVGIATAPAGYVLAHTSSDVARHCELLSPVLPPGRARVVITPGRVPGAWESRAASLAPVPDCHRPHRRRFEVPVPLAVASRAAQVSQ